MRTNILRRVAFFFLVTCIALSVQNNPEEDKKKNIDKRFISSSGYNYNRLKTVKTANKPGFFRTLFAVALEQWADTKNTTNYISESVNNNFLPENAPPPPSTTTGAPDASTTTEAYKIKRSELMKIIRRNLKGINRLYNLELADARKQSSKTYAEFRKNLTSEISKFL